MVAIAVFGTNSQRDQTPFWKVVFLLIVNSTWFGFLPTVPQPEHSQACRIHCWWWCRFRSSANRHEYSRLPAIGQDIGWFQGDGFCYWLVGHSIGREDNALQHLPEGQSCSS